MSNIHPSAMIGSVIASIFILKPISHISHGVRVVPILAQRMIPIPCWRLSKPAQTNQSIIIVTTVLLCKIAVANVPIPMVWKREPAYFCMVDLMPLPNAS